MEDFTRSECVCVCVRERERYRQTDRQTEEKAEAKDATKEQSRHPGEYISDQSRQSREPPGTRKKDSLILRTRSFVSKVNSDKFEKRSIVMQQRRRISDVRSLCRV